MAEHLIRLYQSQLLQGCVDVRVQAETAEIAARIALTAAAGDPDDSSGERRYVLPDGTRFHLDPEDEVVDGDIWAEIIVDGIVARSIDRPVRFDLDEDQALALSVLLHRAMAACQDEQVAAIYDSMVAMLPDPPEKEDDSNGDVPDLRPRIPIRAVEDLVIDGCGMIRTKTSPPVVVAVLHDGSNAAFERAIALTDALGVAIALSVCAGE